MKTTPIILLLLAIQVQQADALFFCLIFGWLGGLFSGTYVNFWRLIDAFQPDVDSDRGHSMNDS